MEVRENSDHYDPHPHHRCIHVPSYSPLTVTLFLDDIPSQTATHFGASRKRSGNS
jgi:hypothetical protein